MVTIQNYVRAGSLEEAYELNQKRTSLILGGMLWTKMQNRRIQTAIDLCDLGLDRIEENEEEFSIGARCLFGSWSFMPDSMNIRMVL